MDGSLLGVLAAVAAVVAVAVVLRAGSRDEGGAEGVTNPADPAAPQHGPGAGPDDEPEAAGEEPEDDDDPVEVVAVTCDGYAFVPDTHAVRLVPPDEEGEAWKAGESSRGRRGAAAIAMSWHANDFTGARVVRGSGEEPWRVEALGRDGEYAVFAFETRDAADAALGLFRSRRVVRETLDDDGRPLAPSAEQFAEARRLYEETERELASTADDDESGAPA